MIGGRAGYGSSENRPLRDIAASIGSHWRPVLTISGSSSAEVSGADGWETRCALASYEGKSRGFISIIHRA